MSFAISSLIPFPDISWWAAISSCDTLYIDVNEHFQKMSFHNRYYIAGSNGMIQLSVPLAGGRDQHAIMRNIGIFNQNRWQVQHWRTISSVYRRSPYFDFYERDLQLLFETPYSSLTDFNLATIHWLKQQLKISFDEIYPADYKKEYEGALYDLRGLKPAHKKNTVAPFPQYYQLFSERNGFLSNLSILDLLFSEGPYTMKWITEHRQEILLFIK
jgi:hypothetical protein